MKTADMSVIELSGTPRERGRLYGETAKDLIAKAVEAWKADLGNFNQGNASVKTQNPDAYIEEFLSQTNYTKSIQKWAPALLEEVRGIAEGAGQDFQIMLGFQLIDEEWVYGLRRGLDKPINKCTAFGLPNQKNSISYAGQNMDVPSWVEGLQVLLRVMPKDNAPEALVFTKAGSIGLNGLNASSLGITCNTLAQLNYATDGLPVSFIVRSVLERSSIEEAEQFLRSIKHASGQNYILSSPEDMRCFECCGTSVVRYAPEKYQGRVFHSNHPLVNPDENNLLPPDKKRNKNTVARLDSISNQLGDMSREMTLKDIKAALAAHDDHENPVSRQINSNNVSSSIGYTAGSSIYELGATPRLHLAAGPPCETDFKIFEFISEP